MLPRILRAVRARARHHPVGGSHPEGHVVDGASVRPSAPRNVAWQLVFIADTASSIPNRSRIRAATPSPTSPRLGTVRWCSAVRSSSITASSRVSVRATSSERDRAEACRGEYSAPSRDAGSRISWRVPPRHYGPWEQFVVPADRGAGRARGGRDVVRRRGLDEVSDPRRHDPHRLFGGPGAGRQGMGGPAHRHRVRARRGVRPNPQQLRLPAAHLQRVGQHASRHHDPRVLIGEDRPGLRAIRRPRPRRRRISDADRHPRLRYEATIHHGIQMDTFPLVRTAGDYLLFFGRIHPHKGAAEAIDVAARVGMPLVLAGIVQDREYFERSVEPRIDGDRVRYIGSVGPDERGAVLGEARALLHLILFEEPFGFSVIEPMACGTPVVFATRRGSMPELVQHGVNGALVDAPDDAWTRSRRWTGWIGCGARVGRRTVRCEPHGRRTWRSTGGSWRGVQPAGADPVGSALPGGHQLLADSDCDGLVVRLRPGGGRRGLRADRRRRSRLGALFLSWEAFQPSPDRWIR